MLHEMFCRIVSTDAASLLARLTLGMFYVLARFRSFYDPSKPKGCRVFNADRFSSLAKKLCMCGFSRSVVFWTWVTATTEVLGGTLLVVGLLTPLAAVALLLLTLRATMCTAAGKVIEQNPVDRIDCVSCYLWRVEGVYIALATVILLLGPGQYSLDSLVWRVS